MSLLVSSNNNEVYYFAKKVWELGGLSPYFPKHFPHYTNKYLHMEEGECGTRGDLETLKSPRT